MFEPLGIVAFSVLRDVDRRRCSAPDQQDLFRPSDCGEIERVAWLRKTDEKRAIGRSLLTDGYARNWNVRADGEEKNRQAHLLERARRQGSSGRKIGK